MHLCLGSNLNSEAFKFMGRQLVFRKGVEGLRQIGPAKKLLIKETYVAKRE